MPADPDIIAMLSAIAVERRSIDRWLTHARRLLPGWDSRRLRVRAAERRLAVLRSLAEFIRSADPGILAAILGTKSLYGCSDWHWLDAVRSAQQLGYARNLPLVK